jgi:hypothetical protein
MLEWPSIVPGAPENYYIVANHYGRSGTAFARPISTGADRRGNRRTQVEVRSGSDSE